MAEEQNRPPPSDDKPKRARSKSKPLTLHSMTVEEALQRTLVAGPSPEKQAKKAARMERAKRHKETGDTGKVRPKYRQHGR